MADIILTEFTPGGKVKAQEINSNFTELKDAVEEIDINYINKNGTVPFGAPQKGVTPVGNDDLATRSFVENLQPSLFTPNAINKGPVSGGLANPLSYSGNVVKFRDSASKNLLLDFNDGTATDYYGNTVTLIGGTVPTFSNGKAVLSGNGAIKCAFSALGKNAWTIEVSLNLTSLPTGNGVIYENSDGKVALNVNSSGQVGLQLAKSGYWDICNATLFNFVLNTDYTFRLSFTGTKYILQHTVNGGDWLTDKVVYSTELINGTGNISFLTFGGNDAGTSTRYLTGTMDNIRITVGCARDDEDSTIFQSDFSNGKIEDYYKNDITVLGNAHVENGKIVCDGTGDGIKCTSITTLGTGAWSIEADCVFNTINTQYTIFYSGNDAGIVLYRHSNNKLCLYLSSTNTSYNIVNALYGSKADFAAGTTYKVRLKFTGTQYIVEWSIDNGVTWTTDITVTSATIVFSNILSLIFGVSNINTIGLSGTISNIKVKRVSYAPEVNFTATDYLKNTRLIKTIPDLTIAASPVSATWNMFVKLNGMVEALNNARYVQPTAPTSPVAGDVWDDTSIEPIVRKKYVSSAWVEYPAVYAGSVKTDGGGNLTSSSLMQPEYNYNFYNPIQLSKVALGTVSGTVSLKIDRETELTAGGAVTLILPRNLPKGIEINCSVKLTQGASPYAITLPAAAWENETAPTLTTASKIYKLTFTTTDGGSTWAGAYDLIRKYDYANRVGKSANTLYTADANGKVYWNFTNANATAKIQLDGIEYNVHYTTQGQVLGFFFDITKGQTWKVYGAADNGSVYFIPEIYV